MISKLDRQAAGEETFCTLIKKQSLSPAYRQTMKEIAVIAVEDDEYYGTQQRAAGEMHPADEIKLAAPSTEIVYAGPII